MFHPFFENGWLSGYREQQQSRSFSQTFVCLMSSNINVLVVLFAQVLMELFEDLMAYAKARFGFQRDASGAAKPPNFHIRRLLFAYVRIISVL